MTLKSRNDNNKRKGAKFEQLVADYFVACGVVGAERRVKRGSKDQGDITGLPGVVVEVKNAFPHEISAWLREVDVETRNASADIGVVLARIWGQPTVEAGVVMMRPATLVKLLQEAGYISGSS